MIGMGFTNDWHALAACRVILGLFEAGFFPVGASPEPGLTVVWFPANTSPQGLRLPPLYLVCPLRHGQAVLGLLPPRCGRFGFQWYLGVRSDANEWPGWLGRMAVSFKSLEALKRPMYPY
jgi:hypothetical protein